MESRDFRHEATPEPHDAALRIRDMHLASLIDVPETPLENPLLESELRAVAEKSTKVVERLFSIVSPIGGL